MLEVSYSEFKGPRWDREKPSSLVHWHRPELSNPEELETAKNPARAP